MHFAFALPLTDPFRKLTDRIFLLHPTVKNEVNGVTWHLEVKSSPAITLYLQNKIRIRDIGKLHMEGISDGGAPLRQQRKEECKKAKRSERKKKYMPKTRS